jgi:creatine kinase
MQEMNTSASDARRRIERTLRTVGTSQLSSVSRQVEASTVSNSGGDVKDTADFKYENYTQLPAFTPAHKSLMSKVVTMDKFEALKGLKTSKGYTLSNAIQTGVKTPHLGVGITAGDEESWTMFKDVMYPVIKGWHGYDPVTDTHKSDLDPSHVAFTAEQARVFDKYVLSTRIRAARNVSGYGLPAGTTSVDRASVESVLLKAFDAFEGELQGQYYPLGGMTDDTRDFLLKNGFLFQIPKQTNLLWHAGAAREWPNNRGIFHNDAQTALCWVNEEDHCRIISMEKGGNVKSVFTRFCAISKTLSKVAEQQGTKLMYDEKLGFLGTCPSNLGTGLRASVMVRQQQAETPL